ncbi:MAG: hypothetical protein C7B44_11140 [Sulfobacillus thermosulfidooxidans]|uniref:hypothetical protein n=1 Tax=Sulfobacillus TaxID=28033 RepID=UPI000CD16374|nr:hypothetical protein [Sulfobacillus sp. hq2]MCY0908245.1 hypothetical protein [Sulfobacillus thermotolerans]POB11783.1 hypothetical protein CO251_02975 [Sulfobacillus sp. hq2]PSR36029.1 MAG: hypothetical protein C7B44_11140 [Sulfobacillus thermosulfidooxidans]
MRTALALIIAATSAIVGAIVVRARRPTGPVPMGWVMIVAALGALVAEVSTILWVGPPRGVWQPAIGGVLIGVMAGIFSARNKKPPKE